MQLSSYNAAHEAQVVRQHELSLALTLDVIGERWTLLILREAFFGKKRFEEFQKGLGIARNILNFAPQSTGWRRYS